jgi:hypothetical protein
MTSVTNLGDLVGSELSGVAFVRSYVELQFDGPVLRSLAPPAVREDDRIVTFAEPGSRDALCSLIGSVVSHADDCPDVLRIGFANGAELEIAKASPGAGPEIAHFVPLLGGRPDVASMWTWENLIPSQDE